MWGSAPSFCRSLLGRNDQEGRISEPTSWSSFREKKGQGATRGDTAWVKEEREEWHIF